MSEEERRYLVEFKRVIAGEYNQLPIHIPKRIRRTMLIALDRETECGDTALPVIALEN